MILSGLALPKEITLLPPSVQLALVCPASVTKMAIRRVFVLVLEIKRGQFSYRDELVMMKLLGNWVKLTCFVAKLSGKRW